MAALKRTIVALRSLSIPHIILLGPVPVWKRGLKNEVLSYFVLHHALIPERTSLRVYQSWNEDQMRSEVADMGAEYISAWGVMCNASGCLTRVGDRPDDVVVSDQHHLTQSGSRYLIRSIADKIVPMGGLP
jgi:hypothetical protein